MRKEDCRINMEVVFGKVGGQLTKGTIVKLNRTSVKVRAEEARGRSQEGVTWRVPYSLLHTPAVTVVEGNRSRNKQVEQSSTNIVETLSYNVLQNPAEQLVLEAIASCYSQLNYESLKVNSDTPSDVANEILDKRDRLINMLDGLFAAYGKNVSEKAAYEWFEQKRSYNN